MEGRKDEGGRMKFMPLPKNILANCSTSQSAIFNLTDRDWSQTILLF